MVAPEGRKRWPDVAIAHLSECDSNSSMVTQNHFVIPTTVLEKFRSRGFPEGVTLTADHCTEFPIPSFVRFHLVLSWEFPSPAWAVASCISGPQAGGTPQIDYNKINVTGHSVCTCTGQQIRVGKKTHKPTHLSVALGLDVLERLGEMAGHAGVGGAGEDARVLAGRRADLQD